MRALSLFCCAAALLLSVLQLTHNANADSAVAKGLGEVRFESSCSSESQDDLEQGLALLHHMSYTSARVHFSWVTDNEPQCAMAYWGLAMSLIHPLWSDAPDAETFDWGQQLVARARAASLQSPRETAWIAAVSAYFDAGRDTTETANLQAFADGWYQVHTRWPDDVEAKAFYALALLGTAPLITQSAGGAAGERFEKQQTVGALTSQILAEIPTHPGALHYKIHAYDTPKLAAGALPAARRYSEIAPTVPHALHMPSHIYTRLGLWQESVSMNLRSAKAAQKQPEDRWISLHYLHALDYLAYAYLQRAEDEYARQVKGQMDSITARVQPHPASAYTLAAIPARLALERQQWSDAVAITPATPEALPWENYPAMEAISWFARGLGAAHTGQQELCDSAQARLELLAEWAGIHSAYWAEQVTILRLSIRAWQLFNAEEHSQPAARREGLSLMQQTAQRAQASAKHPITPSQVLPASELYADMLLASGDDAAALAAYKVTLKRSPGRLNSLLGAGYTAERLGMRELAEHYYQQAVEQTDPAATTPERLVHARTQLIAWENER